MKEWGLMRFAKVTKLGVVVALVGATLFGVGARADAPHDWAAGLQGCDPSRPAVAHHADQQVLANQPTSAPVPCGMLTGWPTAENRIEVTNNGTLIYLAAIQEAAPGVGGLRGAVAEGTPYTENGFSGYNWSAHRIETFEGSNAYPLFSAKDHNVYVDHDTGRLFVYIYNPLGAPPVCGPGGATTAFSDDNGATWFVSHDIDHSCAENPTLLTAVRTVSSNPIVAYKNVVYLCGDNTSSGIGGAGTPGFSCAKSLDGGRQWLGTTTGGQGFYSGNSKDSSDPYPECAGAASSAGAGVQPLPDGTLTVIVSCGGNTYLSESVDEGATWSLVHQMPNNGTLRADSAANLYLLRLDTTDANQAKLLLSHSTDGGATWSAELNVIAPHVTAVGKWFFVQGTHAVGQVGHVAVAYFGTRDDNTEFPGASDGFITETRDALNVHNDPEGPVFWSGQVNDPSRPLMYNTTGQKVVFFSTSGETGPSNFLDFNGGALSPDGQSVWGSFQQSCGTDWLQDPNCQKRWPGTSPDTSTDGFAGRLVWPPAPGNSP